MSNAEHIAEFARRVPGEDSLKRPVTRSRQLRTLALYLLVCGVGALPLILELAPGWRAAGLGLWFPGAGFLAAGGWAMLLFPVTLALFLVAVFLWFATGNVIAPTTVWLLAAGGAGPMTDGPVATWAFYVPPVLIGLAWFRGALKANGKRADVLRRAAERNAYLPRVLAEVRQRAEPAPVAGERELSADDLAAVRYVFDRALQPLESFEGFNIIEQFQPSALRYQLNHLQFVLAVVQSQYAPNFRGYLSVAQRNLIDKLTLPKVWSYWRWESLWGHLRLDYDPAHKDNIMLTGWSGVCLNTYTMYSGDKRYAEPASLTFSLPGGRTYRHSAHSFQKSLLWNYDESPYCLFPCEPNWIYPVCNLYGINSVASYDAAFGTNQLAPLRERFREQFEAEFMDPDGAVTSFRSKWTGLGVPASADLMGLGSICFMAAPSYPEISLRAWAILRQEQAQLDEGGELTTELSGPALLDAGNYRMTGAFAMGCLAVCAREHGDRDVAEAALRMADARLEPVRSEGALSYGKASTMANAILVQARISRSGDWRRTVNGERAVPAGGPVLSGARYPDVLVAKAISLDGESLDLVLHPGKAPGAQNIGFEALTPGASYLLEGAQTQEFVANEQGRAIVELRLDGRTELRLVPKP